MITTHYVKLFFWFALVFLLTINSFAQLPPETPWSTPQIPHPSVLTEPAYLQTVHDADFDIDFTKISDASLGNTGAAIQHQYAKVQAWNADMSLIALGFSIIINADDYSLHTTFSPGLSDARWSHIDPEIRFYGDGEFFKKVNMTTGVITTLHQFPGYGTCTIGPWEGNISTDDRYVVVTSQDETKASVYDILNDIVISSKNFPSAFDWVSVTPWGNYVAVSNNGTGKTELYDLNFNFVKDLSNLQSHADFAIDSDGNQVFVQMCPLRMVRLDNLQETDLLPATAATVGTCGLSSYNPWVCGHVSGRSFTPGWALISTGIDDCNNSFSGYYHRTEIFLLKLDGSGTVKKFGFSRSTYSGYLEQAKASISPDGLKVIFTSDWDINGNGGNTVDYIAAYNGTTLAVETRFFVGEAQRNGILLNWLTDNEINNKGFELQHSANATDWSSIGFIAGSGTTLSSNSYDFFDKNAHSGINYYRFKQIDFDGKETFSNIISVVFNQSIIDIYPNPTSGKITLNPLGNQKVFYELFDQLGRSLQKGEIENGSIDISDFQNGQYFLKIQNDNEVKTFFVIKK